MDRASTDPGQGDMRAQVLASLKEQLEILDRIGPTLAAAMLASVIDELAEET